LSNFDFLYDKKFIKNRKENLSYYFGNVINFDITWEYVFADLEASVKENSLILNKDNYYIVTHNVKEHCEFTKLFCENLQKICPKLETSAHLYISLTTSALGSGKHIDKAEVFYWQMIGKTKWIVDNGEYILNPGDVIYIPIGNYHKVISLTPRAGLSLGLDYLDFPVPPQLDY
jgi:ribosomal protein L16 Arg81 hydroxylase